MSCFLMNKSNTRYEVFKDGERLFNTKFTQVILHSGLIVFIRDLQSESVVLTLATNIKLPAGSTRVSLVSCSTQALYEIETLHESVAESVYNQLKIAAGQIESKASDEPSMAVASTILPPIQQVTNTLANCLEQMTANFNGLTDGGGGECSRGPLTQRYNDGGYFSTYDNGTYTVRGGQGQEQMDFQVDEPHVVSGWSDYNVKEEDSSARHHVPARRKRHSAGDPPGFDPTEDVIITPSATATSTAPSKRSKFHNDYTRQVFVGNLPQSITESELQDIFSSYGRIERANIISNDSPGVPYIAFVIFYDDSSAAAALKNKANIHMKMRNGTQRRLNIQAVKPRPPR